MRCTKQDHPWNPRVIELLGNLPYPFILDSFSPQRVKSCLESSQLLWLCRFLVVWDRPFTSFKKYLLSCCFLPGSVRGAGNKNMEWDGEPALMKFNALRGQNWLDGTLHELIGPTWMWLNPKISALKNEINLTIHGAALLDSDQKEGNANIRIIANIDWELLICQSSF